MAESIARNYGESAAVYEEVLSGKPWPLLDADNKQQEDHRDPQVFIPGQIENERV